MNDLRFRKRFWIFQAILVCIGILSLMVMMLALRQGSGMNTAIASTMLLATMACAGLLTYCFYQARQKHRHHRPIHHDDRLL